MEIIKIITRCQIKENLKEREGDGRSTENTIWMAGNGVWHVRPFYGGSSRSWNEVVQPVWEAAVIKSQLSARDGFRHQPSAGSLPQDPATHRLHVPRSEEERWQRRQRALLSESTTVEGEVRQRSRCGALSCRLNGKVVKAILPCRLNTGQ